MLRQQHVRSALLSTLTLLLLLLTSAGAPGTRVSQATTSSTGGASVLAATRPCNLLTPFNASNFPAAPNINNAWFPLAPGSEFVLDGRVNVGGQPLAHQVVLVVTDLTKMVHGVRTVVLWERDINESHMVESELAFHAQDNAGNIWNLGEYPAEYTGGQFSGAPDTWISGLAKAQGGTVIPGNPQAGTPVFLQAYAPGIIGDCGQVSAVGQQNPALCVPVGCYDNVLVVDETSPGEPGTQQKYYASPVGNFEVGATDNDPQGETLMLAQAYHLSRDECLSARQAALALEEQAFHDTSQKVYSQTVHMEQTGFCETIQPTVTPTRTRTATPTRTPTRTPMRTGTPATATPTRTGTPATATPQRASNPKVYLPLAAKNPPQPTRTPTPTLPPAIFDGCRSDPNPASAPNYPVRIVNIDKVAEVVTVQNVSAATVSLEDWNMCSINGNEEHDEIYGTIGPGQARSFPNVGGSPIWNDIQRDDGALYNAAGYLVSYWVDQ